MSSSAPQEHEWTNFEMHTLLCLMAKGVHLAQRGNKSDEPVKRQKDAMINLATELNKALHGEKYDEDIPRGEINRKVAEILSERKGIMGKGGYMERATKGRITRGLKQVFDRQPNFDYNGSVREWNMWRKEAVTGSPPHITASDDGAIQTEVEHSSSPAAALSDAGRGANCQKSPPIGTALGRLEKARLKYAVRKMTMAAAMSQLHAEADAATSVPDSPSKCLATENFFR